MSTTNAVFAILIMCLIFSNDFIHSHSICVPWSWLASVWGTIRAGTFCKDAAGCMTHNQGASEEGVHKLQTWETDCRRAAIDYDYYRLILMFIDNNGPFCRICHYRVPRYSPTYRHGC
jgi:hypothetical protein